MRIERVAENAIVDIFESTGRKPSEERINVHEQIISRFTTEIEKAISDPKVAGFKSVICYRVGLAIPAFDNDAGHLLVRMLDGKNMNKLSRLEDERLSPYFVHLTAKLLERSEHKKPLQFHTGVSM